MESNWPPNPASGEERTAERRQMVTSQLSHPRDSRSPIQEPALLAAFRLVPRHKFMPEHVQSLAYRDRAVPIGFDQTISQPYIVAAMIEALQVSEDDRVLDIGSGSGYQSAVLSHLSPHVFGVEVVPSLYERARLTLGSEGYHHVKLRLGDGNQGWPEEAPFTRIIAGCAAPDVPPAVWEQLAVGGRFVIPLHETSGTQALFLIEKLSDGSARKTRLGGVSFVPFVDSETALRRFH